jgi:type IV pilus biogenesis protein PilP
VTTGINDAVAVALNQDTVADQPAADQPVAEPEPEGDVEAPAPTLTTNASVAKQATERNALNANRVALLGIFGTPTSRYAMVRLASGRVKKVQVGDTVEGGRIAGITAEAVKYQKGSRIVTLSLP